VDRVETIAIDNDRQIAVRRLVEGDSDRTVVFCHPSPGSGLLDPDPEQTWSRGITLLAIDRAGYGASDRAAGEEMTVGGSANDLAHVLERVVDQPVSVVG